MHHLQLHPAILESKKIESIRNELRESINVQFIAQQRRLEKAHHERGLTQTGILLHLQDTSVAELEDTIAHLRVGQIHRRSARIGLHIL